MDPKPKAKSDKRVQNAKSQLELARNGMRARQKQLKQIPVELQVKTMADARSPEVLEFATKHMAKGGTYEELRRKLGLGPANQDHRWREVRSAFMNYIVPETEADALKAHSNQRLYFASKLETFIDEVEGLMLATPNNEEDRKLVPNYMKLKLEGLKALLAENDKSFAAFMEIKKAKTTESRTQGPSILIQNNYHVNRPGDRPQEVREVSEKVSSLIGQVNDASTGK